MAHSDYELFTSKQVSLIKSRCRKFRVGTDQVDDCIQQLALKALESKNKNSVLKCKAIDNHIKSLLRKEMRYQAYLLQLRENFQETVVYHNSLRLDVQYLASSMTHPQQLICELLTDGFTHKQISQKLNISLRTIGRDISLIKQLFIKCYI